LFLSVDVPEAYGGIAKMLCFQQTGTTPACAPPFRGGRRLVPSATYEFRGPLVYDGVVGLPSLAFPAKFGVRLMRLLSALICAALLALAFSVAIGTGSRPFVVGVFVAVSPEVLFLSGMINANAVEAAASVCLWTALLTLVRAPEESWNRLIPTAGIAAAVLAATRGLSPVFLLICVVAVGLWAPRQRVGRLFGRRDVRRWAICVAFVALASAGWTTYVDRRFPLTHYGYGWAHGFSRITDFARGTVGEFGLHGRGGLALRPVLLPAGVYVVWLFATVLLVAAAGRDASRSQQLVLGALIGVSILIPVAGDAMSIGTSWWVGRHVLAVACGVPIMAGASVSPRRRSPTTRPWGWTAVLAVLAIGQVVGFVWSMHRYVAGEHATLNPLRFLFSPTWSPPFSPAVLVAAFAASVGGLVIATVRLTGAGNAQSAIGGSDVITATKR
jgi:hypothetical protein